MGIFKGKEIFTIKPWLTDYKQNVEQLKKILGLSSDNMLPAIEEGDEGKVVGVSSGKYALVEGGGGSSDFSTATVTLTVLGPCSIYCAVIDNINNQTEYFAYESGDVDVILYKGKAHALVESEEGEPTVSCTGDITYDRDSGEFVITGDGSISISVS